MELGKVVGQVVSTVKMEQLAIGKLLLVRFIDEHGKAAGKTQVALDTIGAGQAGSELPGCTPGNIGT